MNNYGVPNQPGMAYGYNYGYARPQAKYTQPLTQDQITKLRQNPSTFDLKVEQEDIWRAVCTHKEKNGQTTLVKNSDGSWTCTICGETFNLCESSKEEVEAAVKVLIDMLQTSKTVYVDAPDNLIAQYYQVIPLLKKFPELWKRAMDNFAMYDNNGNNLNQMGPGYSGFNAMYNLLTNPYAGYAQNSYGAPMPGYPQAPVGYYGAPMPTYGAAPQYPQAAPETQQPMYYGAPMPGYPQAPMYQQPVDPNANPMAYGVPTAPAPGVIPPQAPAAAPAAPAQQAEVQQQQTFNV